MSIPEVLCDRVFEAAEFVSADFCKQMIARAHELGFEEAMINTERGVEAIPDIRNNDRVVFDDPALASSFWWKVKPSFSASFNGAVAVGLNERFRLYRYHPGHFFDWHQDGEYRSAEGGVSRFTMMVYLNEGFEGGGTSFADVFSPFRFADFTIRPATGKALFFHHPLSHRGDPVLSGVKYALRTDVMFDAAG
ncbi:2OG-Fe(II) oxygenase [Leisingera sp. S132]|uniref:2OG-Fe(II) oxygenase n=1 Tax=Leisingera sp. S132 TaxID=2867016 RepID=UPI0021A818EE|nr:2OG-Fe(II) oxygenase [Leisingera sp. S132]UWQ79679.1 2OG-Fe(II) oxygenase [Leisingera sp. S132]